MKSIVRPTSTKKEEVKGIIYMSLKERTMLEIKMKTRVDFKTSQTYEMVCIKNEKEHILKFSYLVLLSLSTLQNVLCQ